MHVAVPTFGSLTAHPVQFKLPLKLFWCGAWSCPACFDAIVACSVHACCSTRCGTTWTAKVLTLPFPFCFGVVTGIHWTGLPDRNTDQIGKYVKQCQNMSLDNFWTYVQHVVMIPFSGLSNNLPVRILVHVSWERASASSPMYGYLPPLSRNREESAHMHPNQASLKLSQ